MVMGMANLAMVTGNIGREGVGVNPLRGQNNVQGSCDMGSFPHEFPGYRHVSQDDVRGIYEQLWGRTLDPEPGLRIPNMFDSALAGTFRGALRPGRGHRPVRPQHPARRGGAAGDGPRRRPGPVPQRDRPVRPRLPARHVVPGEGRHLHQRRAADQPGAARASPRRSAWTSGRSPARSAGRWATTCPTPRRREIMDEIAATTPTFAGVSFARLDELGSMQWPVYDATSTGHPDDARRRVRARQGQARSRRSSCRPPSGRRGSSR